jgi:group I intron endonuclease
LDFDIFIKVAELIKTKAHLTTNGWNKIISLKSASQTSLQATYLDSSITLPAITFLPVVIYTNMASYKKQILSENVNKAGIYRLKNLISGETYIGSSRNITKRFYQYFSVKGLINGNAKNMYITRALLKYDFSNFSLEILEYCDPNVTIEREQYYLDNFRGEYNILNIAGSFKGFKHSIETILKMKSRKHTDESKAIMSKAKRGKNHHMFGKKVKEEIRLKISKTNGLSIKITDIENNNEKFFTSIRKAAEFLSIDNSNLSKRLKTSNFLIIENRFRIEKL